MPFELLSRANSPETQAATKRALASLALPAGWTEAQTAELIAAAGAVPHFRLLVDLESHKLVLVAEGLELVFPLLASCTDDELRSALGGASDTARLETQLAAARQEIEQLQTELEETNRGVMALYSELDERAFKLKRADELKSRFLSYASHELRTPLNGISGLARLLIARKPQGEELKQLTFIQQAAQEMREMVDDLLDLAKVEAGKITVHPSEFGLELVFGALRGMFRPIMAADAVELHFEDTSAVPPMHSDEAKVMQILRNFISNALKFTERGEIRVWAELAHESVRISVKDTGIGIAQEDQVRIFEEFTQIDHPLQNKAKGTGLGLPLCKRLAELLGGDVEVDSQKGLGSTFTLILPLIYSLDGSSERKQVKSTKPSFTVLHVEDEEIDRYLVGQLLRFEGNLRLIHALDGAAAIEVARRERPNLIILDVNLPRMGGLAVGEALRASSETSGIPIALLSATNLETLADTSDLGHFIAVLSKDTLADASALLIEIGPPVRLSITKAS